MDLTKRYSRLEKILRVTVLVLAAVRRMRRIESENDGRVIYPNQLAGSIRFWIGRTQKGHFSAELSTLHRESSLPRSSPLSRLSPFIDSEGLLRLGGRLGGSLLSDQVKHPYILPRRSHLSTLLIDHAHRRTFHGGAQLTLSITSASMDSWRTSPSQVLYPKMHPLQSPARSYTAKKWASFQSAVSAPLVHSSTLGWIMKVHSLSRPEGAKTPRPTKRI